MCEKLLLQNNQRFLKICATRHLADLTRNAMKVYAGVCLTTSGIHTRTVVQNAQWIQIVLVSKLALIKTVWILVQERAVVMHVAMLSIMSQCAAAHLVTLEIRSFCVNHMYQIVSFFIIFLNIFY